MTKSDEVIIEPFLWLKQDDFCSVCGKGIGKWAVHHSHKCQACNIRARMKKQKEEKTRVST